MTSPEQHLRRPPARWWRAVCVLGLLAGLLGMHGLAPGGGLTAHGAGHPPHTPAAPTAASADTGTHTSPASEAHAGCPPGDGSCGGGHLRHADAVCASGAVSDGPVLPVPVPDPVPVVVCEGTVRAYALDAPDGARAPPTLAELQLLRI
ncbi:MULTISPECIES: DUF6153 family protein [Streptomyces]|uniref:DUF6153 family protein n=1 Tax=Streptomyces TaxID=1883 RepID=UPI00099BC184|nr:MULTISPECIES: DUF6153 family protein [Streptomyces]MCL7370321.1 DUF6153 family protein [Streptomyces ardesiacus]